MVWIKAKLMFAAGLIAAGAYVGWWTRAWTHDRVDAEFERKYVEQVQINDSTQVVLAGERAKVRELEGLQEAAREVQGRLVAGFKAHIEFDSVAGRTPGVEVRPPLDQKPDLVHVWRFIVEDSVGTFVAVVAVPPYPVVPELEYTLHLNPIEPSIGFVRSGNRYVAVVSCSRCSQVTIEAPFVDPREFASPVPRLSRWVGGQWNLVDEAWTARAGLDLRLAGGLSAGLEGRRVLRQGEEMQLLLGAVWRF